MYTPQECSRLCAKISGFYGKGCTHFSRQWITTKIENHMDNCGRDGDAGTAAGGVGSSFGSAGVGTGVEAASGKYRYLGQCIFFSSENKDCCATKQEWTKNLDGSVSSYCGNKYGDIHDNWDSKHRTWRLKKSVGTEFTPSSTWPVTSSGRRLAEAPPPGGASNATWHELVFLNGTKFYASE